MQFRIRKFGIKVFLGKLKTRTMRIRKYSTIRKFFNLIMAEIEMRFKRTHLWSYPFTLSIEPTNMCNLKCPLCPTGEGRRGRKKGMMSFEDFKKIIDETGDYLYHITFNNWGEPLLHKDIYKMIEYAHNKKIATSIATNFTLFKKEDADRLINSGLDFLDVSIDSLTQEIYQIYRVGGKLEDALSGLKYLIERKRVKKSETPIVEWQFLIMRHNEHLVDSFKKMAEDIGADLATLHPISLNERFLYYDLNFDPVRLKVEDYKKLFEERINRWLPKNEDYIRRDYKEYMQELKENKTSKKVYFCPWLWRTIYISWDGGIAPCCKPFGEKEDFGTFFKNNFRDIWNNELYKSARALFKQNRKNVARVKTYCDNCIGWEYP